MKPSALLALSIAFLPATVGFGIAVSLPCPAVAVTELPASAANVWRIATKTLSASACPVVDLGNGAWLFLTAKHVTKGWVNGATGAIVEDRTRLRKLIIISVEHHPKLDLAIIRVKGDGKDIPLFSIDLVGDGPGDLVYTVGYPTPTRRWLGYSGFRGLLNTTSSRAEHGMSGGALLDAGGLLSGILEAYISTWEWLPTCNKNGKVIGVTKFVRHLPTQSFFVPLQGLEEWLRKYKVIE